MSYALLNYFPVSFWWSKAVLACGRWLVISANILLVTPTACRTMLQGSLLARVHHSMLHLHRFPLIHILDTIKLKLVTYLDFVVYPLVSVEKLIGLMRSEQKNAIF